MFKPLLLLLLLAPLVANAVIYKSVDSEGNVVFGDQPSPNAEVIPTPSPNTVHLEKPKPEAIEPEAEPRASYSSLSITSPTANETIRSNPGLLSVSLQLTPKLNIKAGHTINILVDGYVLIRNSTTPAAQIPDISRGTHRVQAVVTDKEGTSLIKSAEVTFFMHRQSLLLNKPGASRLTPMNTAGQPVYPGPQGTNYRPGPAPAATSIAN